MPELPEVETVKRGLAPVMVGQVITSVDVRRPDLRWPFPENMAARLAGQRVRGLSRRAKYILVDLTSGETLIIHLGMSGRMQIEQREKGEALAHFHHRLPLIAKHDHVVIEMQDGARITFNDARRFGMMDLCATDQLANHRFLHDLGPEPLGNAFNEDYLVNALKGRNTPIKTALLDQKIIAGLGNIYVCESLWRAKISPLRKAGSISARRVGDLVPVIRQILLEAIDSGGSSLKDFRQTSGELGYFQHSFAAYGREGDLCRTPDCKGKICRIVQAGRSTFYCNKCQR